MYSSNISATNISQEALHPLPHLIKEKMVEQLCTAMCEGEHTPNLCRQVDDGAKFKMGLAGLNSWLMYKQKKKLY